MPHSHQPSHPPQSAAPPRNRCAPALPWALGNPKSIVYVTALLPPFVDTGTAITPQLVLLAGIALSIDVAVSLAYILAGKRLSAAMARPAVRRRLDLGVGVVFLLIAAYIIVQGLAGLRSTGLGA